MLTSIQKTHIGIQLCDQKPEIYTGYVETREKCLILFFFFQAEDGIRDDLVTGVQTCALPILIKQLKL